MPIHLEIPDGAIDETRALYKSLAEKAIAKIQSSQKELDSYNSILKQLENGFHDEAKSGGSVNGSPVIVETAIAYNKDWSWAKKAEFVLVQKHTALTAKEIVDTLLKDFEPGLQRAAALNSLPATLSVASRAGKFKRRMVNSEYVYDL